LKTEIFFFYSASYKFIQYTLSLVHQPLAVAALSQNKQTNSITDSTLY